MTKQRRSMADAIALAETKQRAFDALERMARAGHGPTFSQQAVWLGQSAAHGYGKTSEDFAGAILALEKIGGVK